MKLQLLGREGSRYAASSMSEETENPLLLFEELRLAGQHESPEIFAARYPSHPQLLTQIHDLLALDSQLDDAVHQFTAPKPVPHNIDGYEVLEQLGAGGSGIIFRARHVESGRLCALKVIALHSEASRQRLIREVELARTLEHRAIARTEAAVVHADWGYIEQELLVGKILSEYFANDGVPKGSELRKRFILWRQIVEALAYAHERQVIHRDIKPANIVVNQAGDAKVIDFGLAIPKGPDRQRVTRTGVFVGSYNYAAPEQLAGKHTEVGPWTDIFALGLVGYELFCGRPAFHCPSLGMRLAYCRAALPALPRQQNRAISRSLQRVIVRATQVHARKRYAEAGQMLRALNGVSWPNVSAQ